MKEFESLVKRTHKAGLKLIMDFVPNHVARQYHSDSSPKGVENLGETDNPDLSFLHGTIFTICPDSVSARATLRAVRMIMKKIRLKQPVMISLRRLLRSMTGMKR